MLPDAFFRADPGDGQRFVATGHTRGPWSAEHQHAGPPSALLARAIERVVADDPAFQVVRLSVELMAPVPIASLAVTTSVLREGRTVRRIDAALGVEGRPIARATGLAIRTEAIALPTVGLAPHDVPAPPEDGTPWRFPVFDSDLGYGAAVEARCVRGGYGHNPTTVWIRTRVALVDGEAPSPLQRAMIAADSGNGIAVVLDPRRFTFVNADLTVYLHRPPEGEWVCLDAVTVPEPSGVGLTTSRLFDRRGQVGSANQALVVTPRVPAGPPR